MKALKPLKLHLSQTILHSIKLTAKAPEHQIAVEAKKSPFGGKRPFFSVAIYMSWYLVM